MTTGSRETGISVLGDLPWSTHVCHFYETGQDLLDILIPFFRAGLKGNELCVWVVTDPFTVEDARDALRRGIPEAERYLTEGRVEIIQHSDWYLKGGVFDAPRVVSDWNGKLDEALAKGFAGLRGNGLVAGLFENYREAVIEFERALDANLAGKKILLLCSYPLSEVDAAVVFDVVQAHQRAGVRRGSKWEVIENVELKRARREIEKLNQELEQRVAERTLELANANEELRREITRREQVEAAEIEGRQLYENLVQSIDGIVCEMDGETLRVTFVSRKAEEILGYPLELWTSEPDFWVNHLHPDDRAGTVEAKVEAAARHEGRRLNYRMIAADGSVVWLKDIMTVTVRSDGRTMLRGVKVDETEIRRVEDALRESEERFRVLIENSADAIALFSPDGSIHYASPSTPRVIGYTPEELLSFNAFELVHPENHEALRKAIDAILGRPAAHAEVQVRFKNKNGEWRWLEGAFTNMIDEPHVGAIVNNFRDITERKRVEQRLREYEKAVEGLDEMIVVVDRDYRYVVANRAFLTYRGLEAEQLVGRRIFDLMNPGVFDNLVKAKLDECFEGQIVKYEMKYNYPQLGERDLSISYFPIEGPNGVDRVACILEDITEIKRAEEALRSSETKLRRLLDSSIVGVVFWDTHGNLLSANDLFLNMIGYSREDLEQGRLSWKDITPPEYTAVDEQAVAELLATGHCTPFEKEYIRKDGSRVFVMVGLAMLEGHEDQGSSFIMDISERKQIDEELRQSEERFRQLAESITEVFWMTDPEKGKVLYLSPTFEKIWGRSRESVYRNPNGWLDAIHPEHRQRIERAARTRQVSGEYDEEYQVVRPDGTVRWIRDRAFPVKDKAGRVYRVTGIAEDITERKQAEERLKTTTEQLRALSARLESAREEEGTRIARELHDELGAALSSLRWDLDDMDEVISEATDLSQFAALRKKIDGMTSLTDTTVNTVRRISSELRPFALDELGLVEAIEGQARQFQSRTGIIVHRDFPPEIDGLTQEQSAAIFRIFQEALTNVLRHAQATRLFITGKQEADEFVLTVSDNGRGITEEEQARLPSLGLLGMRERANLFGGGLQITGVAGKGTVVTLRVPLPG